MFIIKHLGFSTTCKMHTIEYIHFSLNFEWVWISDLQIHLFRVKHLIVDIFFSLPHNRSVSNYYIRCD